MNHIKKMVPKLAAIFMAVILTATLVNPALTLG